MIRDLRTGPAGELRADICIIGAGAAGIALAREFKDGPFSVVLLDSGGMVFDADAHALSAGESVGVAFSGLQAGRHRGFGGTTRTWAGQCIEMDKMDLSERAWVRHSGWPIGIDELAPYYRAAEAVFGLRDETYDERTWQRFGVAAPSFDPGVVVPRMTVYSPAADFGIVYRRELDEAKNVSVCLYGHALRFAPADSGARAARLEVGILGAPSTFVRARAYVVCTGGLESARLLLLSNERNARGLGNEFDNVGRFYQDHPNGIVATVETRAPRALQDLFGLLYRGRVRYFPKLRLSEEQQCREHVLNAVSHLVFEYDDRATPALRRLMKAVRGRHLPARLGRGIVDILGSAPQTADILYRRYALGRSPGIEPRRIHLQVHAEQAPDRNSRILLGSERDAFGQPRVRMDWRIGLLERRTFEVMTQSVASEFARLGLGLVRPKEWLATPGGAWTDNISDSYHYSGSTRMSADPKDGVVDPGLRLHGVDNVYVCSSSVFPTSGYANPTLTIVALALRLARALKSGPALQLPLQEAARV